jgi:hypothetical protein
MDSELPRAAKSATEREAPQRAKERRLREEPMCSSFWMETRTGRIIPAVTETPEPSLHMLLIVREEAKHK